MSLVTGNIPGRALGPQARQGAMDAHASFDAVARAAIMSENRGTQQSMYGYANDPDIFDIGPQEPVFRLPGYHPDATDLYILSALNGLGATASTNYPDDPEMVRQAVRAQVQPIGLAVLPLKAGRFQAQTGDTIALAGNNSIWQPRSGADDLIRPGDLVTLDVPNPGENTLNLIGTVTQPGVPQRKYRLVPRRFNTEAPARTLRTHINAIVENKDKWAKAMNSHRPQTTMWLKAATATTDSALVTALLALRQFVNMGFVQFAARDEFRGKSTDESIAVLAQALNLTNTRPDVTPLSQAVKKQYTELKHKIIGSVFYDGKNPLFEYAWDKGGSTARFQNQQPKRGNAQGEFLDLQLNHFMRCLGAYTAAIHDEQRFIIGKATTGVSPGSAGRIHLSMGIARP